MARSEDGKTKIRFQPWRDGLEIITSESGKDIASIGMDLDQAIEFTANLARACDELAKHQRKPAPKIIIPEGVARLPN